MQRYKAIVEYDGSGYIGMQKQKGLSNTVQAVLEEALSRYANNHISIFFSGRTDAGVHALGQVIHFDLQDERNEYSVLHGINFHLLKNNITSIIIKEVSKVSNDFHARFSAKKRKYLYCVLLSEFNSPILLGRVFCYKYSVDVKKMLECSKILVGKKMDFSAFCNSDTVNTVNTNRTIDNISIEQVGNKIHFYFEAKSFLHNMIRIIVGVLLEVGRGKISIKDVEKILLEKRRPDCCNTVPACGLYFLETVY